MHKGIGARLSALLLVLVLTLGSFLPAAARVAPVTDGGSPAAQQNIDTDYALVQLKDKPVASYTGGVSGYTRTMPAPGRKLALGSTNVKKYQTYLAGKRGQYKNFLKTSSPGATVVREYSLAFNGVAVKLNGTSLDTLRKGPGSLRVQYSQVYYPQMNKSNEIIGSSTLWNRLEGQANAGRGIKVGVIDSGIDQTHPFFDPTKFSYPSGFPKGDTRFTTPKVIVARVYYHGIPGTYTAEAINAHGTHVAGTIAGVPYPGANAKPYAVSGTLSGVAPGAWLGNYNVFPGDLASASSQDILQAVEDTVRDGMDVVNMSLGGGSSGIQDLLSMAVDSAVDAGLVYSISAGNEGPGEMTIGSPGVSAKAITVGASTNSHLFGVPVTVGGKTYIGAAGDFNLGPVSGPLAVGSPLEACTALTGTYTNKIVLVKRGSCSFTTKIRNAQNAGAAGVIVYNNVAGPPISMAHDGTSPKPTIPAVMVSQTDGQAITAQVGQTAFIGGTVEEMPAKADVMAGFSSRGPNDVDYRIEPDVTAPGVNIYSSVPGVKNEDGTTSYEFAAYQGTSMAAPHVSGAAALLRSLHPTWTPTQIRSALVTTGDRNVYSSKDGTSPVGVQTRGGGRIDLTRASDVTATFSQPTISFGKNEAQRPYTYYRTVSITNVSGTTRTFNLSVVRSKLTTYPAAVNVTVTPNTITLAPGQSSTFRLALNNRGTTQTGDYEGDVVVRSGSNDPLLLPFWIRLK